MVSSIVYESGDGISITMMWIISITLIRLDHDADVDGIDHVGVVWDDHCKDADCVHHDGDVDYKSYWEGWDRS